MPARDWTGDSHSESCPSVQCAIAARGLRREALASASNCSGQPAYHHAPPEWMTGCKSGSPSHSDESVRRPSCCAGCPHEPPGRPSSHRLIATRVRNSAPRKCWPVRLPKDGLHFRARDPNDLELLRRHYPKSTQARPRHCGGLRCASAHSHENVPAPRAAKAARRLIPSHCSRVALDARLRVRRSREQSRWGPGRDLRGRCDHVPRRC